MVVDNDSVLYHGTSYKYLPSILKHGIMPRKMGSPGNWKHTKRSGPGRVYLSNSYAIYFAGCTIRGREPLVVFEIDMARLDISKIVPDEDWLITRSSSLGYSGAHDYLRDYVAPIRPDLAYLSLKELGNVAYIGPIKRSALTRYAVVETNTYFKFVMLGYDPIISIGNQKIRGEFYKSFSRWLFEETIDVIDHFTGERIQALDRKGIRIVTL